MKNRRSLFATWRFVYLLSSWPEIRFAKCCEFRILAVDFLSFVVARPDDYPSFTYATWWANENSLPTSGLPMFWFWIPFEKMVAFSSIFKPQFSLSHNLRHRGSPLVFLTTMNRDPFLILSFLTSVQKQGSSPEGCCHCGHTQPFQLALFSNQLCRRGRWVSPQLGFLVTYSRSFQWTLLHLSVQDDSCWYLSARLPWWKFCDNIRIIHVFVKQKKTAHSVGGVIILYLKLNWKRKNCASTFTSSYLRAGSVPFWPFICFNFNLYRLYFPQFYKSSTWIDDSVWIDDFEYTLQRGYRNAQPFLLIAHRPLWNPCSQRSHFLECSEMLREIQELQQIYLLAWVLMGEKGTIICWKNITYI